MVLHVRDGQLVVRPQRTNTTTEWGRFTGVIY